MGYHSTVGDKQCARVMQRILDIVYRHYHGAVRDGMDIGDIETTSDFYRDLNLGRREKAYIIRDFETNFNLSVPERRGRRMRTPEDLYSFMFNGKTENSVGAIAYDIIDNVIKDNGFHLASLTPSAITASVPLKGLIYDHKRFSDIKLSENYPEIGDVIKKIRKTIKERYNKLHGTQAFEGIDLEKFGYEGGENTWQMAAEIKNFMVENKIIESPKPKPGIVRFLQSLIPAGR